MQSSNCNDMTKGPRVAFIVFLLLSLGGCGATKGEAGKDETGEAKQLLKLTASDGAVSDKFGTSVAISSDGARVVAGGSNSGSAYVFDGTTGEQLLKLTAADGAAGDKFGNRVAVSSNGARVVAGAFMDDDSGPSSGSAYVFDGATGEQLLKLVAGDAAASAYFGVSVDITSDGARVVVGASGADDNGTDSGSVYVFNGATGEQLLKLVAADEAAGDYFGATVAVSSSGSRVVVGSLTSDRSGKAYVFNGDTGEQLLKLVPSDAAANKNFGSGDAVAITSDGAKVFVGAWGDGDHGLNSGAAYVFDGVTGEQLLKLTANDGAAGDLFSAVAVSSDGARVLVGASSDDASGPSSGSAYILDGATGEQLLKIVAGDGDRGAFFGKWVDISSDGARVVVGAAGDDDHGTQSGAAYVFVVGEEGSGILTHNWFPIVAGVLGVILVGVAIWSKARQQTVAKGSAAYAGVAG